MWDVSAILWFSCCVMECACCSVQIERIFNIDRRKTACGEIEEDSSIFSGPCKKILISNLEISSSTCQQRNSHDGKVLAWNEQWEWVWCGKWTNFSMEPVAGTGITMIDTRCEFLFLCGLFWLSSPCPRNHIAFPYLLSIKTGTKVRENQRNSW